MKNETARFRGWSAPSPALERSAKIALEDILGAREGERVLIVTNPVVEVSAVSLALYDAAADLGALPTLIVQPVKSQLDDAEEAVLEAIGSCPEIFISVSAERLGKDRKTLQTPLRDEAGTTYDSRFHYLMTGKKQMRSFWSPHLTRDIFERAVPIDYGTLRRECAAVKAVLDRAVEIDVTAKAGTRLTIGLRGRLGMADDGDFTTPGRGGNVPAGEVFISPELGTANGRIVYDGSITLHDGDALAREPIYVEVKDGFVEGITGGAEADRLRRTIGGGEERARAMGASAARYIRNARNIGELGIGLNPRATILGNMLEDEKARRTCHIAIGSNYDNDAPSLIHLDGLVREPSIVARFEDGSRQELLRDGDLLVPAP